MPNWRFSNFKLVRWQANLNFETLQQAQELQALLTELQKLNRRAARLYTQAAEHADRQHRYLLRMARTCTLAVELQELMVPWLRLFQEAAAGRKPLRRLVQLQKKAQAMRRQLQRRCQHAIDPNGGDSGFALEQVKLLSREIAAIIWTCKKPGRFRPVNDLIYHTQRQ